MTNTKSTKIRPGMYQVTTTDGDVYNVLENQFSGQWLWTVLAVGELTSDPDMGLFRTKAAAMAALASMKEGMA